MCGIFAFFNNKPINQTLYKTLTLNGMKIQYRGPDNTTNTLIDDDKLLIFHRLCINDLSEAGNQPLYHPNNSNILLICNGEIFNYKELCLQNNFKMNSSSDCEVILHMYLKFGIEKTLQSLDGAFALVLIDNDTNKIYFGRDPIGVRSMYIGYNKNKTLGIASELKSLHDICENINQFNPGCYMELNERVYHRYYNYVYPTIKDNNLNSIMNNIKLKLESAVSKRMLSERPIGCLLSGGLDSSLITALVSKIYPGKIKTFSVGLEGSVDIVNARKVADFIGTEHHELILTENDMLNAIKEDIETIETYDTTTIRASTPMYLLCKYIKKNTDITVIFSGEGSDEASGSYMYFHNAPDKDSFNNECVRLLKDLSYYDVLRADKSTASCGLEIRTPFLDKDFLQYYMSIDPEFKTPKKFGVEKFLLRKSFEDSKILPSEILWRKKEGMSDGVSTQKRGWYEIIQEYVNRNMTDDEFNKLKDKYKFNTPRFKESMFFREIFNNKYPGRDDTIPYYWIPKWSGDISEPSARVLTCYNNK